MNTHTFTFIIGYRHRIDRFNNLKRTLDWINGFAGVDVILVEQDTHSKISHLTLRARHIFLKSDKPYNRSWAFNVGTKLSKSNVIVFSDSDLIMEPNQFIEGLKAIEQYDMVSPYNSVLDLNTQESTLQLQEIVKINRPGRGETDNQKINICGGISIFRKDAIQRIAGWNEDFIGWGGEDDFQAIKVENFLSNTTLPYKCYHLYHNRETPNQSGYQRTLQLLQSLKSLSKDDLVRTINMSLPKIGMVNKYDNF